MAGIVRMGVADQILRFSFEDIDIRGELVYLDESWRTVLTRHDYPAALHRHLGEALAAAALLSITIKFDGTLILQVQGSGPVRSLVAQVTSGGALRGLARFEGHIRDGDLGAVFGQGSMVMTVMKDGGDRYQSIVALEGRGLTDALSAYFRQSEQLPSSFRLFVSKDRIAGLFLQQLPASSRAEARDEHWQRINLLADTLTEDEMLSLQPEVLLHRLFHEEQVRLFAPHPLHFACTCSRQKVASTLVSFGEEELQDILAQEQSIKVDCEFCNHQYVFTAADVEALFRPDAPPDGTVLH